MLNSNEQVLGQLQLAEVLVSLADVTDDAPERDRLLSAAQQHAERALTFLGPEATDEKSQVRLFLGTVSYLRHRYDDALAHAAVAHKLVPARVAPALILGEICRRKRRHLDVAGVHRAAIDAVCERVDARAGELPVTAARA